MLCPYAVGHSDGYVLCTRPIGINSKASDPSIPQNCQRGRRGDARQRYLRLYAPDGFGLKRGKEQARGQQKRMIPEHDETGETFLSPGSVFPASLPPAGEKREHGEWFCAYGREWQML